MKPIKQLTKIALLSAAMTGLFAQAVHAEELKEEIITKNETVVIQPTNPSKEKGYPVAIYTPDNPTKGKSAKVTYVSTITGDNVRLKRADGSIANIRLLSLNVPEERGFHTMVNVQVAKQAKKFVITKLKNAKTIELVYDTTAGKITERPTKRTLAYVYVDGKDLGALLVSKGYARVADAFGGSKRVVREYKVLENKAKSKNVGVWKTITAN